MQSALCDLLIVSQAIDIRSFHTASKHVCTGMSVLKSPSYKVECCAV